jgi:two-component system CheB/CheR fusion protein
MTNAWETRAAVIIDSLRDYAVLTLDPAGIIQTWNSGAIKIFGYEAAEIVGQHVATLFPPDARKSGVPEQEMQTARATGSAADDRWMLQKGGTLFFASGILSPLQDADRFGYAKVLRDLTEQHIEGARRDELLTAERIDRAAAEQANRMKDAFLAMLSHELRNPLALMLLQAEILLRSPEARQSEQLRQSARIIHDMVRAQARIVEDLLDVSRARTGNLAINRQLLPLTFVITDSIGALRREAESKQLTLDVQLPEAPLIVQADPTRVRQIAWNLLNNAIKFTPSGGTIRVRLAREGTSARFDVEDTGEGLAAQDLPHIFEWFRKADIASTRGREGMGIGLALVQQLVELHEGRLQARSEGLGKGSCFTVWLPLYMASAASDKHPLLPALEAPKLSGLRVLVVDDSTENGEALRDLLELEGAHVVLETSAHAAIARAAVERFDVLISDIAMPAIDGYAMLTAIRSSPTNAATPAIAYTGYSGPREVGRAQAVGFQAHLTKPVDVQTLLTTIRQVAETSKSDRR